MKIKLKKYPEDDNEFDIATIVVEADVTTLNDLFKLMKEFTLACGYHHDTVNKYFEEE